MTPPARLRLLFVCSGNICRSPMAAALAERLTWENAGRSCAASSAGLAAEIGSGMTDGAVHALAALGITGIAHHARQLDEPMLAAADKVYVMTRAQLRILAERFPAHAAKAAVLRDAAGLSPSDVADPYGFPDAVYEKCAAHIAEALDILSRRDAHVENAR